MESVKKESMPWFPAPYDKQEAIAVYKLSIGQASANQQKVAFDWIVQKASRLDDLHFFPGGVEGQRNTEFALGRSFVARQIEKLVTLVQRKPEMYFHQSAEIDQPQPEGKTND